MKNNRQDIYESRSVASRKQFDEDKELVPQLKNRLDSAIRRSRQSFMMFWFSLLLFIGLLGWVLITHHAASRREIIPDRPAPSQVEMTFRGGVEMDMEHNIRSQLILDELSRMEPEPVPSGGAGVFNAEWVKQAAYHILQAEMSYDLGNWDEAITHYASVTEIFPDLRGVHARLALCYMRIGEHSRSRQSFVAALEEKPDEHRIMNNLGVAVMAEGEYEEAKALFLRAIEIDPDYLPVRYNLSMLYSRIGELPMAEPHLRRFLEDESGDLDAILLFARTLAEIENWDEAANLLRVTAEAMPDAVAVHLKLGQVLVQKSNLDEAMESLLRGVSLLDRTRALAILSRSEFDPLRNRSDFRELVDRLGY